MTQSRSRRTHRRRSSSPGTTGTRADANRPCFGKSQGTRIGGVRNEALNASDHTRVRCRYVVPYRSLGSISVFSHHSFQLVTTAQSAPVSMAVVHCASYTEPFDRSTTLG